jgi:hypothetical protein
MGKTLRSFLFLLLLSSKLFAQSEPVGTWAVATIVLPGDSSLKWGGYAESQIRENNVFSNYMYYQYKAGISYDIDKNFTVLVGSGRYNIYDYHDLDLGPINTENRLWEQITTTQYLYRLKLEHRYRVEQRWVNGAYRNRFRYRINAFIPLNKTKIEANTYFLSLYDEVFLNNAQPNFETNRISATAGYQVDKSWIVQVGWLNQYNYAPTQSNNKNNLILMLMYRINRKHAVQREHIPTTTD